MTRASFLVAAVIAAVVGTAAGAVTVVGGAQTAPTRSTLWDGLYTDEQASRGPATRVEQRIDVATMLDCLPPEYREVIVLREWQQMSYAQMASVLGVPERTAETRLTRARRMLRQRFGGYG